MLHFRLYALRFWFEAQTDLRFPAGGTPDLLRGALGAAFRRTSCSPACSCPEDCPEPGACAYARLFKPRGEGGGPSGLVNRPRPFVLRVSHLVEPRTAERHYSVAPCALSVDLDPRITEREVTLIPEGSRFHIGVNFFDLRQGAVGELEAALARLGRDGLGRAVCGQGREGGCGSAALLSAVEGGLVELPLEPALDSSDEAGRIAVRFLTPTELKGETNAGGGVPSFELLAARIRDRISTLRALYGEGPLRIDFRGFAERAARVRTVRAALLRNAERRTLIRGTRIQDGFLGEVEYEGDLTEFLPYLRAAVYTGVGRQTVWGKGEIAVDVLDRRKPGWTV